MDRRLQRGQLSVRVEDVELGIVLPEGGPCISRAVVGIGFVEALPLADDQRLDRLLKLIAVIGEVVEHLDSSPRVTHDRHQIGRGHLRLDELHSCSQRPHLVRHRHRGHVEIKRQEPAILKAHVTRRFSRNLRLCYRLYRGRGAPRNQSRRRARGFLQLLKLAELDSVWDPVVGKREIFRGQSVDHLAALVSDGNGFHN